MREYENCGGVVADVHFIRDGAYHMKAKENPDDKRKYYIWETMRWAEAAILQRDRMESAQHQQLAVYTHPGTSLRQRLKAANLFHSEKCFFVYAFYMALQHAKGLKESFQIDTEIIRKYNKKEMDAIKDMRDMLTHADEYLAPLIKGKPGGNHPERYFAQKDGYISDPSGVYGDISKGNAVLGARLEVDTACRNLKELLADMEKLAFNV